MKLLLFFYAFVLLFCTVMRAHNNEIFFGQSGSFSGHFAIYGNAIKHGIDTCFKHVNAHGGIHGKILRLISMDDHGDATITQKNIAKLQTKHDISMFIGVMGTRGLIPLIPDMRAQKIALFFPWGGDPALREPNLTHIINGPGYLEAQLDSLVHHLTHSIRLSNIALFHADDDFSTHAAKQLQTMLNNKGLTPIAIESYNRFTMDIARPAQKLVTYDPKIVICLSTSMPAVKLINYFFEEGHFGTRFLGIDSTFLVPSILRNKGAHFEFTSPVPHPKSLDLKLAQTYRKALATYYPVDEPSTLSFTYFIASMIIVEALKSLDEPITKEKIITAIENMKNTDIEGFDVTFNPSNRHAFGTKTWIVS